MKKRATYIVFCAALFLLFLFVLFTVPDNEFLYKNALGDCSGRTEFMYKALYIQDTKADVVLFGSSRTMNSINDSARGKNKLLNMGYCRFGRNLDAFFIEEYLKTHTPSKIILEIRESEGDNSHPLTPFLLPLEKIAEGFNTLDVDVLDHLYNKWLCNLKYLRGRIFSQTDTIVFTNSDTAGFWESKEVTASEILNKKRVEDSIEVRQIKNIDRMNANSEFYFKKIKALCAQKKVELFLLYIPSYGNLCKSPPLAKDYSHFGTIILPSDSIFTNSNNFSNYNHLNKKGANQLSHWLSNYLESN